LERIPVVPPIIRPLVSIHHRPVWSVMIPVYNCSDFLGQVLKSVLDQDPGEAEMQIEVVDDASTDADVMKIVEDIGMGRIGYFRQATNVGSLRNFETCINRAIGKYIHLLHGDDKVKMGFYNKISQLFDEYPEAGAAFSNYDIIDESGKIINTNAKESQTEGLLNNWLNRVAGRQRIQYAAMVVKRKVYERLGSFYGSHYGEDWEMWVRIAKFYPVAYTPEVLAQYRTHPQSISWHLALSGQIYWDLLFVIEQIKNHIPEKDQKKVLKQSRLSFAKCLLGMIYKNMEKGLELSSIHPIILKTYSICKHPFILAHLGNICVKISWTYFVDYFLKKEKKVPKKTKLRL
jgi:glycosyltransferase involved in cell wall biosynthesis